MRFPLAAALACALLGLFAPAADASPNARFGIQDDAWLVHGAGTLDERLDRLEQLGVDVVRFNLHWDQIEASKGQYDWEDSDAVLNGLHGRGIPAVVGIVGSPSWANGGRAQNFAPGASSFAGFARTAASRYRWVKQWLMWNEPNQARWLRPTTPATYVRQILNPGYAAIHAVIPGAKVAGGVTAPRGSSGGVSPVKWIRGMRSARARLDVYAHYPYPSSSRETPFTGGCNHCETITMATLDRLVTETRKAFKRPVRLWLTELGYQSNPPDRLLGVAPALQASYIAAAAYKAWATPRVDLLIQYLYRDEPTSDRWQSGLISFGGATKLAIGGFEAPLAEVRRKGSTTVVWGTIRRGTGGRPYRLQRLTSAGWTPVGGVQRTRADGTLQRTLTAKAGTKLRLLANDEPGNTLVVR